MRPIIATSTRGFGAAFRSLRYVHATPLVSKSVKEKISSVADKVNKKVGQGLASAIETGEKATEKTKETLGSTTKHAKDQAEGVKERADEMGRKAKDMGSNVTSGAKEAGKNAQRDL